MNPEFSRQIFEKTQISNFIKIHPAVEELFHADGVRETDRRTDGHAQANSCFSQFLVRA